MSEVSTLRLYVLRAMYALIAFGLGSMMWPRILSHEPWQQMEGVAFAMLAALSAVAVLGIRYPLQMLPVLVFELAWKIVWLLGVGLPQWRNGQLDPASASTALECLLGIVVVPLVLPWRYVIANYVKKPGDRWRHRGGADRAAAPLPEPNSLPG